MVTETATRIGLDRRGELIYIARVEQHAGRPEVAALAQFDEAHLKGHHLLADGDLAFAVPDGEVTIKNITLPADEVENVEVKVRFEMVQSLLEDEAEFLFDSIYTGQPHRYLGVILRKSVFDTIVHDRYGFDADAVGDDLWRVRAAALGRGYLEFCQREKGDLVCLADFGDGLLSVCFVYRNSIVGLAHLELDKFNLEDDADIKRMAVEFKTIVNFKLASFFEQGMTLPLSSLLLSGNCPNAKVSETVSGFFSVEVTAPQANPAFFSDSAAPAEIPFDKYIVALGLAVK